MSNLTLPEVPIHHQGNRSLLSRKLAKQFLEITGWRVTGKMPIDRRFIFVAGPHTSNWDFVYGLTAAIAMNISIHWLGKDTLFKPPLTRIMRGLGGIPVNRSNPRGVAEDIAETIRKAGDMALIITPEGTRSKVDKWKTGFLRIAAMSDSALVVTTIDYADKVIHLDESMGPGDDFSADVQAIQLKFARVTPKNPDNH